MAEEPKKRLESPATRLKHYLSEIRDLVILVAGILLAVLQAFATQNWSTIFAYSLAILIVGITLLLIFYRQSKKWKKSMATPPKGAAFRGLLPFEEGDQKQFYGREIDVDALYQKVNYGEFRFGVLIGKSGCGKTSLLRAGLIPKLREADYLPVYARLHNPDKTPKEVIKQAIKTATEVESQPEENLKAYLLRAANKTQKTLVLLCDQFEEFFIHLRTKRSRKPFISFVAACYRDFTLPVKYLFTLRDDFLIYISEFDNYIPEPLGINRRYHLENFDKEQATEIIQRSVEYARIPFDADLSAHVAQNLAVDNVVFPTELQIVCQQMQSKRIFTVQKYREVGGKESLVHGYLEDVVTTSGDEETARLILRSLISEEKTGLALTLTEISKQTKKNRNDVDVVLDIFIKARLIKEIPGEKEGVSRYELAHEYLIQEILRETEGDRLWKQIRTAPSWWSKLIALFLFLKYGVFQGLRRIPLPVRNSITYGGLSLLVVLLLILVGTWIFQMRSNWTAIDLPDADNVTALASSPMQVGKMFAAICNPRAGCSLFFSENNGEKWNILAGEGIPNSINSLAIDPFDASTMWIATEGEGIFISNNGGKTWKSSSIGLGSFVVRKIEVDSDTPDLLYASADVVGGVGGFYRSLDGGQIWDVFDTALSAVSIPDFSLATNGLVFVATPGQGVYRCHIDKERCERASNGLSALDITQVRFSPKDDLVYAGSSSSGLFRSTDLGESWTKLTLPQQRIERIYVATSGTLYIATSGPGGHLVWSSNDQGASWQQADRGWLYTPVFTMLTNTNGSDEILVGTQAGVLKSSDRGREWTLHPVGIKPFGVLDIALSKTPAGPIYLATDSGAVFRSDNGGRDWKFAGNGLEAPVVRDLVIHPKAPEIAYAGTYRANLSQSIFITRDKGNNWRELHVGDDDTRMVAIDPIDPSRLYAATFGSGIMRSQDGGLSWSKPLEPMLDPWTLAVAIAPQGSNTLYAGTSTGILYRSEDGGQSWQVIATQLPSIRAIVISHHKNDLIYIGTRRGGRIIEKRGADWLIENFLGDASIKSLIADPCSSAGLFAGTEEGNLFWSRNGGKNWALADSELPIENISILVTYPECTRNLFVGSTSDGLLFLDYRRLWDHLWPSSH